MDPATIATMASTLLMPYVKKAAEEFAGQTGKAVQQKVGALLATLKQRFAGDPVGEATIARFEKNPDGYNVPLRDALTDRLAQDEPLRAELERLLAEIRATGPELSVVQRLDEAEGVTGAEVGEMTSGRLSVNQDVGKGKDVTGLKIDRIGS